MSTQTQNRSSVEHSSAIDTVIGFAMLGCLVAGGVGIWKAMSMTNGADVLFCLAGSAAAFGTVLYFCLGKD